MSPSSERARFIRSWATREQCMYLRWGQNVYNTDHCCKSAPSYYSAFSWCNMIKTQIIYLPYCKQLEPASSSSKFRLSVEWKICSGCFENGGWYEIWVNGWAQAGARTRRSEKELEHTVHVKTNFAQTLQHQKNEIWLKHKRDLIPKNIGEAFPPFGQKIFFSLLIPLSHLYWFSKMLL